MIKKYYLNFPISFSFSRIFNIFLYFVLFYQLSNLLTLFSGGNSLAITPLDTLIFHEYVNPITSATATEYQ